MKSMLPFLQKCITQRDLEQLIAHTVVVGIFRDSLFVGNILTHCASRNIGSLEVTLKLLKQVEGTDSFIWNTVIREYGLAHDSWNAIYLFHQMLHNLVAPDKFTFPFVLKACANIGAVEEGKQIHGQILKKPYKLDIYVQDALLFMYSKCCIIEDARLVFDLMSHRRLSSWNMIIDGYVKHGHMDVAQGLFDLMPQRDIFSWNAIIDGYAKYQNPAAARALFDKMPLKDIISWNSVIDGYARTGDMKLARELFDQMPLKDVITWGILINGYAKSSMIEIAHTLFEKAPCKTLIIWNSLMNGYAKCNYFERVLKLFALMPVRNLTSYNIILDAYIRSGKIEMAQQLFSAIPNKDAVAWNIMIDGYAKVGDMGCSRKLFNALPNKDVISWNALIAGYRRNNFPKYAIEVFSNMLEIREKPDYCTLAIILSVVTDLGLFLHGRWIHAHVIRNNYAVGGVIDVAIIDMYAKCGYVGMALQFFNHIPQKTKDHWNSMLSGISIHGNGALAVSFFEKMEQSGLKPDSITFVCILNACSHAGLVLQGQLYFKLMNSKYGLDPTIQHYGCMVDLLSRSGDLEAAMQLLTEMPMRPNDVIWRALLAASIVYENTEIAEIAAKQLIKLVPDDSSSYVMLSNIYVSRCEFESARKMWMLMKDKSIVKNPGCSCITLDGAVHEFNVGDLSHANITEIHLMLKCIAPVLMTEEYVPGTTYSVDETCV